MTDTIFSGVFAIAIGIGLIIAIIRMRRDKILRFTLLSKSEAIELMIQGKGISVATVGLGISVILFIYAGLAALFSSGLAGNFFLLTTLGTLLFLLTIGVSAFVSSRQD